MARKQVMVFFSALLLITGALILLRLFSAGSVTGASIADGSAVQLSELRALREGDFLSVSFIFTGTRPEARIAYAIDASGEHVRGDDFAVIFEPGKQERQAFRIYIPGQAENELFITISVNDGETLAYRRVAVVDSDGKETRISSRARSIAPIAGLVSVLIFVLVYLVHSISQKKRAHILAHHARQHLAFR